MSKPIVKEQFSETFELSKLNLARERLDLEKRKLVLEERKLEKKFELSQQGLKSGLLTVGLVFVGILLVLGAAYFTASDGQPPLSGWHFVAIIFILCVSLLSYFSLVFWRETKLAAEFSAEGARVDMETGGTADDDT